MSAIEPSTPRQFDLGAFIDACAANEFVKHEQSLKTRLVLSRFFDGYWDETLQSYQLKSNYTDRTQKKWRHLSDHEVSTIREQEKKQKEEYLSIKGELPPSCQAAVEELSSRFKTVEHIADLLAEYRKDTTLKRAIEKQDLQPLEAIASCAKYIEHIEVNKKECCELRLKFNSTESCEEDFVITTRALSSNPDHAVQVQPGTELYFWHDRMLFLFKFIEPNADGNFNGLGAPNSNPDPVKMDKEQIAKLQKDLNVGPVSKKIMLNWHGKGEVIQIPQPEEAPFVQPVKFWDPEYRFEFVKEFFGRLREGSDARSILPEEVVNTMLKDYIVKPPKEDT